MGKVAVGLPAYGWAEMEEQVERGRLLKLQRGVVVLCVRRGGCREPGTAEDIAQ